MLKTFQVVMILMLSNIALADSVPDFPYIVVTGESSVQVAPDLAVVSLQILEFNKNSGTALSTVLNRGREIIKIANDLGIRSEDITSLQVTKNTIRSRGKNYETLGIKGYEVSQMYTITINDISQYGPLADQLISKANISSINASFGVSNKKEVLRNLVKSAGRDAQQRASDLADGMGVKIKSVYAVSENAAFEPFLAVFGLSGSNHMTLSSVRMKAKSDSSNMFVPKKIEFTKSVNVVYKVKS